MSCLFSINCYFQNPELNDTSDLETRVEELEDDVAILQTGITVLGDNIEDVENSNSLQDQRLNNIDNEINIILGDVSDNENNIHGICVSFFLNYRLAVSGLIEPEWCVLNATTEMAHSEV